MKSNWRKYTFEFLSIFVAVLSAFALNNWNDNRRDRNTEYNILAELSKGFEKDIEDMNLNMLGHKGGIRACKYWRNFLNKEDINQDSMARFYMGLTRDFTSIQNRAGYESLKSNGLDIIRNDSLRFKIISLYEYDYYTLKKFEEEYRETQFHDNYFKEINNWLAPSITYDSRGNMTSIAPLVLSKKDKKIFLSYLWKIQGNRMVVMMYYTSIEEKVRKLRGEIEEELKR